MEVFSARLAMLILIIITENIIDFIPNEIFEPEQGHYPQMVFIQTLFINFIREINIITL